MLGALEQLCRAYCLKRACFKIQDHAFYAHWVLYDYLFCCYQLFRVSHVSLAAFNSVRKQFNRVRAKNKNLGLWIKMEEPFLAPVLILIKPFPTFARGLQCFRFFIDALVQYNMFYCFSHLFSFCWRSYCSLLISDLQTLLSLPQLHHRSYFMMATQTFAGCMNNLVETLCISAGVCMCVW